MPFCSKCGTEIQEGAAFCSACGNLVSPSEGNMQTPAPAPSSATSGSMASNIAALLAYILGFITGIIFLVIEPYKNDKFVRFHAFQSIFFSGTLIAFWIVWNGVFWSLFGRVAFLWTLMSLISMLVSLGAFVLWIFLMVKAYNNERFMLPVIGEFAAKQAG